MTKKKILTKTVSFVLVLATVFSMFAITASAAYYSTGNYAVASNSGINVRPYVNASSRYGAASKGTNFKVTQVDGNWGYTPSIRCANGRTVSGWVCLDYCSFKGQDHTHNYNGNRYYQDAHPHEISVRCTSYDSCGGWKWTGENYKVKDCPQCYPTSAKVYYTLSYNANGGSNAPASQRVEANKTFSLSTQKPSRSGYTFLGWSSDKDATASSFAPGASVRLNGNATIYAVWKKNQQTSGYLTGDYSIKASNGSNIRSGAGTNYSKLGAAKCGTTFTVTQVSGSWGYATIQCTNGVKKGWVCLDYCTYRGKTPDSVIKLNVPLYKQTDSRWKNVKIGTKTIGQIGCTTTCIAMVYSYNTGKTVYPNQVKNMLRYSNNDLYWSSIGNVGLTSKIYNSGVTNSMLKTIYDKLKAGRPVIIGASTSNGSSQHWVVVTGYTGTSTSTFSTADFTINDPGYQNSATLKTFLANGSSADRTKVIRIMY